ncbi:heme-binding domain-containing protein [Pseudozobellia sp. WGM2]|uniref:heme-binding domain-containing protein n=1 Tax=Pseudozobellia sp. WGM2 TaxID=2787625 RepID=UPI001AE091A2|nr:heme-binding domain-containing protein [Pseudozobellia sp. WGM2]
MKKYRKVFILLLIVLIALQFYRPERNNSEVRDVASFEKETKPSSEVLTILENTCYDCHSDKTTYPWYASVSPISLWISNHVEEGNEHFNVSAWDSYDKKKKAHKLDELIEEVEEGEMPLTEYTWLHGGSLTENQKSAVIDWARKAHLTYTDK